MRLEQDKMRYLRYSCALEEHDEDMPFAYKQE